MKKQGLLFLLLGLVALSAVLLFNTFRFHSKQVQVEPVKAIAVDSNATAGRLSQAIHFRTVSNQDAQQFRSEEFTGFHKFLEQSFPRVHTTLTKEVVGDYSLLYTWKGRDGSSQPVILMAHQDVVPVEPGTENLWAYPPFEGRVADGYIWGRGAIDDKASLLGILEAVELLLGEGFQPQRTIYLAFGHDEEIGGPKGASVIARLLQSRGVQAEYVLDEGSAIANGVIPGLSAPVALVGIAEKGYVNVSLTVESEGGHSSMPPPHTAVGILSMAINRLEENQMPPSIQGAVGQMFDSVGREMTFGRKLVFANLWLFRPWVQRQLISVPATNAAMRTTTAATLIEGGVKSNVLPTTAGAVVNFRILPGDSVKSVLDHVNKTINDPRVAVSLYGDAAIEPSSLSSVDAAGYKLIERTVRQLFPNTIVAPSQVVGGTDSRQYSIVSQNTYRFAPVVVGPDDLKRIHGTNERISIDNLAQYVRFYHQLLLNSAH